MLYLPSSCTEYAVITGCRKKYKEGRKQLMKEHNTKTVKGFSFKYGAEYFIIVMDDNKMGIGSVEGRTIVPPKYDDINAFFEFKDDKYVLKGSTFMIVIPTHPSKPCFMAIDNGHIDQYDLNGTIIRTLPTTKKSQSSVL